MKKKSGMTISRALGHMRMIRADIDGIIATAVKSQVTHEELGEMYVKRIKDNPRMVKLPEWATAEIRGYHQGKSDMITRYLTFHGYMYDGKLYKTKLDCTGSPWPLWEEAYARVEAEKKMSFAQWSDENCTGSGFYWPSGKPYFVCPYRRSARANTTTPEG